MGHLIQLGEFAILNSKLDNLGEYKYEVVNTEYWLLYFIKYGKIGLCVAESKEVINRYGNLPLPSWFNPKHYASAAVGGDTGLVGEIYINNADKKFVYWLEAEMHAGQSYSGEIVVVLN